MIAGHKLRPKPSNYAEWREKTIQEAEEAAWVRLQEQMERLGTQPIGTRKATYREQLADFLANRDDPQYWTDMLADPRLGRTQDARNMRALASAKEMDVMIERFRPEIDNGTF